MDIKEGFELVQFLVFECETFDIGTLHHLTTELTSLKNLEEALYSQILTLVQMAHEHVRKRKNSEKRSESIVLLVIDSLIFNIYAQSNRSNALELNNSFYASQSSFFSQAEYPVAQESGDVMPIGQVVLGLSKEKELFRKLNQITEFSKGNSERNRRALHGFLETLDYILSRERLEKSEFYHNKKSLSPTISDFSKPLHTMHVEVVNKVIFSSRLMMIESLLQDNNQQLGFALARVYYAANIDSEAVDRKCFAGVTHGGEVMLYNLYKLYVGQFSKKGELFLSTKSALLEFVMATFNVEFLPTVREFSKIFNKLVKRVDGAFEGFYGLCGDIIRDELVPFIELLPPSLVAKLNLLKAVINNHDKWKDPSLDSTSPVKTFFLNRFLFNNTFIDFFYGQNVLEETEVIANYVNDLFFSESLKKHNDDQEVIHLTELVIIAFQTKLLFNPEAILQQPVHKYFVEESILKHDYEQLFNGLQLARFSPKDETQFPMTSPQKDSITSRAKRHHEPTLVQSLNMNVEELKQSEVIRERASVGDSSFGEFVEAMGVEGESKLSQFLRMKEERERGRGKERQGTGKREVWKGNQGMKEVKSSWVKSKLSMI